MSTLTIKSRDREGQCSKYLLQFNNVVFPFGHTLQSTCATLGFQLLYMCHSHRHDDSAETN